MACLSLEQVQTPLGASEPVTVLVLHYTYAHGESSRRIINEGEHNGKKLWDKRLPLYVSAGTSSRGSVGEVR